LLAGVSLFVRDADLLDFISGEAVVHERRALLNAELLSVEADLKRFLD
jgi:hypothetical protein